MKTLFVALGAAAVGVNLVEGQTLLSDSQHQYLFTSFVATHGKKYETKHFFDKFNTFRKNLRHIIQHNAEPHATFTLGVNQFADLSGAEFAAMHKFKPLFKHLHSAASFGQSVKTDIPKEVDWRGKQVNGVDVVGPVPNQGQCGSCWAFSTTGALESAAVINGLGYSKLSEQELVDCADTKYGNNGCEGGLMSSAYNYYAEHGAVSNEDYPYTGKDGKCQAFTMQPVYGKEQFIGYQPLKGKDALKTALVDQPISVALAASSMEFQFYKSGVLNSKRCGDDANHALVAVGYATTPIDKVTGNDGYYIIKNSWGSSWGDKGYIKVASGTNTCGMEAHAFNIKPKLK